MSKSTHICRIMSGVSLIALASAWSVTAAQAQQVEQAQASVMQEVVVTAQRKQENIQDVPISVSAITPESLQATGATDLRQLFLAEPSLTVNASYAQPTYTMRGIGSFAGTPGQEPSVATYVDGFYLVTPYAAAFSLANIERVEVLKGPQGTLFGRNSTGGVIQVVTSEPSQKTEVKGNIGYESYDRVIGGIYATTGLNDKWSVGVTANIDHQGKGWGRNYTLNNDNTANITQYNSGGVKLKYEDDKLKSVFAGGYYHAYTTIGSTVAGMQGGVVSAGLVPTDPRVGLYDTETNAVGFFLTNGYYFNNTTTYDMGGFNLVNRAQYQQYRVTQNADPDNGPVNLIQVQIHRLDKWQTEELQATSKDNSRFQWVTGIFYLHYTSSNPPPTGVAEDGLALRGVTVTYSNRTLTNAIAGYAQGSYDLGDNTKLTAGFRYGKDWRSYDFYTYVIPLQTPPNTFLHGTDGEHKPNWRLALDHKFTDDVMAYFSYNRGTKSGSFDSSNAPPPTNPDNIPVKPEQIDAFEIGLKSEFFDKRVKANLSVFYNNFKNLQATESVLENGTIRVHVFNAQGATFKGGDLDLTAYPTPELMFHASVAYLDSKYKTFQNVPETVYNPVNGLAFSNVPMDLTGAAIPGTSKFTFTGDMSYTFSVFAGSLIPNVNYFHRSAPNPAYPGLIEFLRPRSEDLLNAGLTYQPNQGHWSVKLYGNNLASKEVIDISPSTFGVQLKPIVGPRTIGGRVDFQF